MSDTISLSLVSHTNVGKTTLARTLLSANVGEVRDEAHVTVTAEPHTLIETAEGDALRLWDTPGFGDSARLAKRLAQQGNPIGWFLSQVWDRWRDRPFWSSQQAMKNVREHADVVLYLVSASENPSDAGYVKPEMQILEWIGKPVLALLNQTGQPGPRTIEASEEDRWRTNLAPYRLVRATLTLDAFARCWPQELTLLHGVGAALPAEKRVAFGRLEAAWQARRTGQFHASMSALAAHLARVACAVEIPDESRKGETLRQVASAIGIGSDGKASAAQRAMQRLAQRIGEDARRLTDELIEINGLEGRAAAEVITRVRENFAVDDKVSEGKAALFGGMASGALSGLMADLAAGGLTFGAGVLAGSLLGALGSAGVAKGYNLVSGKDSATVRCSDEFLNGLLASGLLRYLAVAHYGRGRGEWKQSEYPAFWRDEVTAAVALRQSEFDALWKQRVDEGDCAELSRRIEQPLRATAYDLLERLYPEAFSHAKATAAITPPVVERT